MIWDYRDKDNEGESEDESEEFIISDMLRDELDNRDIKRAHYFYAS